MANQLNYPSALKTTLGAELRIRLLPSGVRTPEDFTITVTQNFDSDINPGNIYVKSDAVVRLTVGTKLIFNGITLDVTESVVVDVTSTLVTILDQPPGISIATNSTFTDSFLLLVAGMKDLNLVSEIQTVDTSNVTHGVEKQSFHSKKIQINICDIYEDYGGVTLKLLAENLVYRNREFWFEYKEKDGSYKKGAALITSYSPSSNLHSIKSFRIEARVQPGTYSFLEVFN